MKTNTKSNSDYGAADGLAAILIGIPVSVGVFVMANFIYSTGAATGFNFIIQIGLIGEIVGITFVVLFGYVLLKSLVNDKGHKRR